jgi:hypothetical protein
MRGRSKSIKGVIRVWFVGVYRVDKFYSLWVGTHMSLKFWVMWGWFFIDECIVMNLARF